MWFHLQYYQGSGMIKLCEDHIAPVGTFTTQIPGIPTRLCSQTPLMVFPDFQTSWRTCLLTLLSILKLICFQGALLKEHCFLVKVREAWSIKSVFRGIQLNLLWPCRKRPWSMACFIEVSSFCSFLNRCLSELRTCTVSTTSRASVVF